MKNNNNGPYMRALYQLLAKLNTGELSTPEEVAADTRKLAEWMQNGRYYYTAAALNTCVEKATERYDVEAFKATLLKYMHRCNEQTLHEQMVAEGWKVL